MAADTNKKKRIEDDDKDSTDETEDGMIIIHTIFCYFVFFF